MGIRYKWNRYSIKIPAATWGSSTGDVPMIQSKSTPNSIAAVGIKALSNIQIRFGTMSYSAVPTAWRENLWFVDSAPENSHAFVVNTRVSCADYPYVLIPEYASDNTVIGLCIGYASSGMWKTLSGVNEVYHTASDGTTYANYQVAFCPAVSDCTKGTLVDTVTSASATAYPQNGIGYNGTSPGNLSAVGAYWYEYAGEEITPDYTVTLIASPSNGGSVSGGGGFVSGARATVTATPNTGYDFEGWQENGIMVSASPSLSFDVKSNRTLTAIFKQKLALWVGVDGKARKGVELYIGVDGKARKVVEAYIGVDGKARRFL